MTTTSVPAGLTREQERAVRRLCRRFTRRYRLPEADTLDLLSACDDERFETLAKRSDDTPEHPVDRAVWLLRRTTGFMDDRDVPRYAVGPWLHLMLHPVPAERNWHYLSWVNAAWGYSVGTRRAPAEVHALLYTSGVSVEEYLANRPSAETLETLAALRR